jgi:hypothetical protein
MGNDVDEVRNTMSNRCDMATRSISAFGLALAALAAFTIPAHALDLSGAWASDAGACEKLFTKNGTSIAFAPNSELWGSGFIVDGNSIRGQITKCVIKSRKESGSDYHLVASCASDIMVDQVQLSFKVNSNNSITRFFPGIEGMERTLVRCAFQ